MKEMESIIGYESEKKEFARLIDIMKNPDKYNALGVNTPKGLLLLGEPGLGKTTMARAIIDASGRPAFTCRKDRPDGNFVDEIRRIFEEAKKNAPSIVFLDDMDKYSNEDEMHRNTEEFVTVQSFIDDCREHEVFVLATANKDNCLPQSLLRPGRFDMVVKINTPLLKDAIEIIRYYIKKTFVTDIDVEQIARIMDGRSIAELETVVNEAGIYAGYENKSSIGMDDMVRACLRVIFGAPETVSNDQDDLLKCAYHEAGHALIHNQLEPGSVNMVSIATYSSEIGGVTSYTSTKKYYSSIKLQENRVISLLGGKAAVEQTFGETDTGAADDVNRAFCIVETFIDNYSAYGFNEFERCYSELGNSAIDRRTTIIAFEVQRFYQEARRILCENRALLDRMAKALIEKKTHTLLRNDIDELMINS